MARAIRAMPRNTPPRTRVQIMLSRGLLDFGQYSRFMMMPSLRGVECQAQSLGRCGAATMKKSMGTERATLVLEARKARRAHFG